MSRKIYDLEKMADYDLKNIYALKHEELDGKGLIALLNAEKQGDSVALYIKYKGENGNKDLDDSNGNFLPMRVLYNVLWGRKENGYSNFRLLYIDELGEKVLWGGDCVNSVQTQLALAKIYKSNKEMYEDSNSKKELIKAGFQGLCRAHGCIGDYVLVPAYYNGKRPGRDNWQAALKGLQEKGWFHMLEYAARKNNVLGKSEDERNKAQELYERFDENHFNRYINTMFLWDYVESIHETQYQVLDLKHDEEDKTKWIQNIRRAVRNRGLFMSAMLLIATDMDLDVTIPEEVEQWQTYEGWEVSNIYKKLVKKVFTTDKAYKGYRDVLSAIKECLSSEEYDKVKDVLEKKS